MSLLGACTGLPDGSLGFLSGPPEKITVAGNIVIDGPAGYCVDRSATRLREQGGFVLLGSCASIANNPGAVAPLVPAVLTASVSARSVIDIDRETSLLSRYFKSETGRAALARDGRAASVKVLATRQSDGAFLIKLSDTSPNLAGGLSRTYWRALLDLRGHLVTLSVIEFEARPLGEDAALATLRQFVKRTQDANPTLPAVAPDGGA